MDEIRPEAMRAHIRFLADDLLEGRGTGTRGYQMAANYVADQFEVLELEPAGEDGTYFQPVPQFKRGSLCWLDDRGAPQSLRKVIPEIRARVLLNHSGAQALFADAPHSLDEVSQRPKRAVFI